MRLYLSSFRLGDHASRLLDLAGAGRRAVVIGNALDAIDPAVRGSGVEREIADLRVLGFSTTEADLRRPDAERIIAAADVLWVRGGNVFVLRRALADSGIEPILIEMIQENKVVYAGYSAGAAVLAADLRGFERIDDVGLVPESIWSGLGVLDRPFVPHVNSPGHPETTYCDALSAEFVQQGKPHWALRDGEVLIVSERDEATVYCAE